MFKQGLFCIFLLIGSFSWADDALVSAVRFEDEDWKVAFERNRKVSLNSKSKISNSAVSRAVPLKDLSTLYVPWFMGFTDSALQLFEKVRDFQFVKDPELEKLHRRLPWMYPDDGCFMRAEWLTKWMSQKSDVSKVFAFGSLKVNTPYHSKGYVNWWFHVVPGWKILGVTYVYDPAINARFPMKLKDWVAAMNEKSRDVKVAICEQGTFMPEDDCGQKKSMVSKGVLMEYTTVFLKYERERLKELGRNVELELGDHPPWKR